MSLHAMMTLNLCLESYGAAVHVMDSLIGLSAEQGRRPVGHVRFARRQLSTGFARSKSTRSQAFLSIDVPFRDQVRNATDGLAFEQAQALWLVDVCRCSYEQAATELGVTRVEIAARVSGGRRFIRAGLAGVPAVAPIG